MRGLVLMDVIQAVQIHANKVAEDFAEDYVLLAVQVVLERAKVRVKHLVDVHVMGNVWVYARVLAPILQLQQQKTIQ